jgi:hypothetical protein
MNGGLMSLRVIAALSLLCLVPFASAATPVRSEARVYADSPGQLVALGDLLGELDICTVGKDEAGREFLVIDAEPEQLEQIRAAGLDVEVTWPDIRDKFRAMTGVDPDNVDAGRDFGYFFTYWEMLDTLRKLKAAYPLILDTFRIGPSFQNRWLFGVRISDNPTVDEPEPELFINGATHGREPLGTHACVRFATLLCQNYGTDSLVNWLVRNREFYIIPVMNPDGYVYNSDSGGSSSNWRKNRRGPVPPSIGIDLNRNYGYKWGYDNSGSSPTPSAETYRGPSRFSEVETRAVRSLLGTHKFRTCQDFHTYGRYNLYAWGYINSPMPQDSLVLKEMGDTFRVNNGYTQTGPIYRTIYPTNGGSTDYAQADTLKDSSLTDKKFITYGFCSELGINDFWYGWNLPAYVDSEVARNIPNLYYLARVSGVFFDPMRAVVNDSAQGNRTLQLDANETANLWFRVRNRAIHPLDSAYSISGKLRSLDTMVQVLDSVKSFPLCRRKDSTDNRAAQFAVYCRKGTNAGRVVPLRLELTYRDDTLTMTQPVNFTITIGSNPISLHDVGCTRLVAPAGSVDSGASVVPACSVYNYGDVSEGYNVRCRIGGLYNLTAAVTAHAAGTRVYVAFPAWVAAGRGTCAVSCSTELATDTTRVNDRRTGTVTVDVRDVACTRILTPADSADSGTVVVPACSVYNYGTTTPASYTVRLRVGTYSQPATVTSHVPGTAQYVTFPAWTATPPGTFTVTCSTELAGDLAAANNRKTGAFRVKSQGGSPPPGSGWALKASMPLTPSGRQVKDGGWLAYDAARARIFAAKGYKVGDFYSYNPATDSWKQLASWPAGTEGKLPQKGSAGCADGSGYIYATKGNNTQGFWRYDATGDWWAQKRDVPLGPSNKRVKGGTDIVYAQNGCCYLLKGYRNEFWKYFPTGDSWKQMPDAPAGANVKWDKGSWLAYDAAHFIYAHKAKFHEFYRYDTDKEQWEAGQLVAMPVIGSAGSKKAKDGSCGAWLNSAIYALKGGNTQEYWKHTTGTNYWVEKETIPKGAEGKKVKAGADLVSTGSVLFALKGNKTGQLWKYTPGAEFSMVGKGREGAVGLALESRDPAFRVIPNPLSGTGLLCYSLPAAANVTLRAYTADGRLVATLLSNRVLHGSGATRLNTVRLPPGVYLLRLDTGRSGPVQNFRLVVR